VSLCVCYSIRAAFRVQAFKTHKFHSVLLSTAVQKMLVEDCPNHRMSPN